MSRLKPIRRETLEDQVYRALRQAILEGRLKGGERLVQEALASTFGTSRIPVRDALRRLHQEGLVEADERGGYRVATWGPEDVEDVYTLRLLLEPEALRLAGPKLSEEELDELEALQFQMEEAASEGDLDRYVDLNRSFHFFLYEAAGKRRLFQFIQMLWSGLPPLTPLSVPGQLDRSNREHRLLVQALRKRAVEDAVHILRRHIRYAMEALLERMEAKP
ncbi:GntR family transcriptional regulator [Thermus scotoductus]|uniref:GntR family transcriptional regulator n=1 Tax=Thermus scotoductus TaxID=37636 RepID=A0A430V6U4_THESC|nr:GntR family transcriptional regulator [Thermus scotoductus]RTI02475.1 GntR family transcriptional regulator [Thermus scotoductus]RTI20633.1 GntR family transcriptional regulator [Thermus scotoductus]